MYHSLDICQDVALKLSSTEKVACYLDEAVKADRYYSREWQKCSLAYGFPGLALFFSVMDSSFPGQGYEIVAHEYLKLATETFEVEDYAGISLFNGLTGLGAAAFFCSQQGTRYKKLIDKIDNLIIREVHNYPIKSPHLSQQFLAPQIYNLNDGFAGILNYISLNKDAVHLRATASNSIKIIAERFKEKIDDHNLPGWFTLPGDYIDPQNTLAYPNGCFILTAQYGIVGLLASLAIAALEGFCPNEGYELMDKIATWLQKKQNIGPNGMFWNHTVSLEEEISGQIFSPEINRDNWSCGIPYISRALYTASKALRQPKLARYAEDCFCSMLCKPENEWNLVGTSFSYGRAGHLALTNRMAKDTGNRFICEKLSELEFNLKRFYDPSSNFGFRSVSFNEQNHYMWVDDPGLFCGAAGIALSLLLIHKHEENLWDRIFGNI